MTETDKDIIIAKQNAFIAYLKYNISELNVEKGEFISEIQHLRHRITSAHQSKNKANFNFSYYKQEIISVLKEKFPTTWFNEIK